MIHLNTAGAGLMPESVVTAMIDCVRRVVQLGAYETAEKVWVTPYEYAGNLIPSGCGIVNPVAEIGEILAPYRTFYAVDACQAIGQLPVDVAEIGCHLLSGAGKFPAQHEVGARGIRLSVHYYNTLEDVAEAGRALREILGAGT